MAKSPPAKPFATPTPDVPPVTRRTRVTNGKTAFLNVDGLDPRSQVARRFKDLLGIFAADLGGHEQITEAQHQLARRAAFLSTQLELVEAKAAAGSTTPEDLETYNRTTNALLKVLQVMGLQRVARDVSPGKVIDAFAAAVRAQEGQPS